MNSQPMHTEELSSLVFSQLVESRTLVYLWNLFALAENNPMAISMISVIGLLCIGLAAAFPASKSKWKKWIFSFK